MQSNVAPMDTMKVLLGATIAVLLVALAASWQAMKTGINNTSPDEIARLEKQVKELRAEQDKLQFEKQRQQLLNEPVPTSAASEVENMKLELEKNRIAMEQLELEKANEARDKKVAQDEEGLLGQRSLESKDTELRRARLISDALLIGKVQEFVADGGFIIFNVLMPEQVQVGVTVAIRRKTGILGQFKVSDVTPEGAIANMLPGFGEFQPQLGDELILPPQY